MAARRTSAGSCIASCMTKCTAACTTRVRQPLDRARAFLNRSKLFDNCRLVAVKPGVARGAAQ